MTEYGWNYDYTKTMMMKLFMASPDGNGGSHVNVNFEEALEIIRKTDALTLGVPKIIYLVGWQYNGHDDRYPELFEVNEALKRPEDETALDSLKWLMEEAKAYHTIVSFHINFTDAYSDSLLFDEYHAAGALIRRPDGTPDPIEHYNNKPCYKVSFFEEWNSGLFKKRFDRFLESVPAAQTGSIHVDNFQCYYNNAPETDLKDQQDARNRMLDYVRECGMDVTTEFTYREGPDGRDNYNHYCMGNPVYPIATLDRIPALWWFDNIRDDEYLAYPPERLGGGLPHDSRFASAFYGNIHGEHLWMGSTRHCWEAPFLREFCMIQLPYYYLCAHKRERIENDEAGKTVYLSDGVVSCGAEETITENGVVLKDRHSVLLPLLPKPGCWVFYSDEGSDGIRFLSGCTANHVKLSRITENGTEWIADAEVTDGMLKLRTAPGEALLIEKA